ncbi:MAG: hypothetical protein EOR02_31905 [Mesorhizobium sp.]|nr:MAG: hypothetical protein EOR02_31905 [Mesorhizobium sp.]
MKRLSKRPLHFRDEDFILSLEEALIKGNAAENTARVYVDILLSFGRWLFANNKDPIKDRLDHESLTDDAREFVGKSNAAKLFTAIGHSGPRSRPAESSRSQAALSSLLTARM